MLNHVTPPENRLLCLNRVTYGCVVAVSVGLIFRKWDDFAPDQMLVLVAMVLPRCCQIRYIKSVCSPPRIGCFFSSLCMDIFGQIYPSAYRRV